MQYKGQAQENPDHQENQHLRSSAQLSSLFQQYCYLWAGNTQSSASWKQATIPGRINLMPLLFSAPEGHSLEMKS